jgi:class 3 adenylate cyclase
VIQRGDDVVFTPCHGRYLRDHIPGARSAEVPGGNHILWVDPDPVIDEIQEFVTGERDPIGTERVLTTVLFTDIVGSTDRASELGDQQWRTILDRHDAVVAKEIGRFRGRLVNTTGDGVLATFDGPARGIRCAGAIRDAASDLGLDLRAGLHTGEVEIRGDDIGGIAVHIGQRVRALAGPGEVLVSSTVKDLVVGSGIVFGDHGTHQLRGMSEE